MSAADTQIKLADILEKGGLYRHIKGTTPREVLTGLIRELPPIPSVPADTLLEAVLERESLMPTCIGKGIALPHPRNPLVSSVFSQFIALAYLENPVDWNALDGAPVDTVLLIVTASPKQHLHILSKINYFCLREDFFTLLRGKAPKKDLLNVIRETEKNWE